jgi:hypothetical protein
MKNDYNDFLKSKITIAEKHGFEIDQSELHPNLLPHQKDICHWAIKGGRRGIFGSFGVGKTVIQLEIVRQFLKKFGGVGLITCPLAVQYEFQKDAEILDMQGRLKYITHTDQIDGKHDVYLTNYERIRSGNIDASLFTVATSDEASGLRSLDSQTTEVFLRLFKQVKYRFVATATPSPNRYLELTHYADYLGIMDRGQILTRFFQRDSTKAGNLTLYDKRIKEFWHWVASWACFVRKPSDLGYSDEGYDLPETKINWHKVKVEREAKVDRGGRYKLIHQINAGVGADKSKEDKESLEERVSKMWEIAPDPEKESFIVWHYREDERHAIQKALGKECKSVWGNQNLKDREDHLTGFRDGKYKILSTKPEIAGSGCNFQHHCHRAIYIGLTDNFNDFIQSVHRIVRFMQKHQVTIDIIYTDAQEAMRKRVETKWKQHNTLQHEMTAIIKKYGLNSELYREDLKREMFKDRQVLKGENWEAVNNDSAMELPKWKDNSIHMFCSSIPFGNHFEYSENYNCFGHNTTNDAFFAQMDYITPEIYRTLKPGRICAIHVKDRIQYGYQNGVGFIDQIPFSDHTNMHFIKHGFHFMGRITITTDVVRENNQTYRLSYGEKVKDATKMGVGMPEYVLIFRKPPTDNQNAYADDPVKHEKEQYRLSKWQIDAHGYWKSNGKSLFATEDLRNMELKNVLKTWKAIEAFENYDFEKHVSICEALDQLGKLPRTYMAIPPISHNPEVWTDISRMKTLNADQKRKNLEKHICPLQLDIIERLIERYSEKGEIIADMFGGIMSVPYQAVKMGRKGIGVELNDSYWMDGVKHLKKVSYQSDRQSMFEMEGVK